MMSAARVPLFTTLDIAFRARSRSGSSRLSHRRHVLASVIAAVMGCLSSCDSEAVSSPIMLIRLTCARSAWVCRSLSRSRSARFRSLRSTTNRTLSVRVSSTAAPARSTGTRLPSLRMNSCSNTSKVPVCCSWATARSLAACHSWGVSSRHRSRPDRTSSRVYPQMSRAASFASMMAPSTRVMATPTMLASTSRRIFASRSSSSRYKRLFSSDMAACGASTCSTAMRAGVNTPGARWFSR